MILKICPVLKFKLQLFLHETGFELTSLTIQFMLKISIFDFDFDFLKNFDPSSVKTELHIQMSQCGN